MRYYSHIQGNLFKQLLARSTAVALRKNYLYRVDLDTTTKLSITFSASTRSAPIPLLMPIHCVRSLIHVSVTKLLPFHRSTTFFSHFSSTTHLMQGQSYDPPSARPHPLPLPHPSHHNGQCSSTGLLVRCREGLAGVLRGEARPPNQSDAPPRHNIGR